MRRHIINQNTIECFSGNWPTKGQHRNSDSGITDFFSWYATQSILNWTPISIGVIKWITVHSRTRGGIMLPHIQYSTKVFGALEPPSRFLAISPKQMQISTPNFQHPLSHPFHTLCNFFEIPGYDRSATNNVRVTCSVDFNTATDAVFKLRSVGLWHAVEVVRLWNCYLGFFNIENWKIQNSIFPSFLKNFSLKIKFSTKKKRNIS